MSMNHYDLEENSRMELLVEFKVSYGNAMKLAGVDYTYSSLYNLTFVAVRRMLRNLKGNLKNKIICDTI